MDILEIANTMSNLEADALEAFQNCAIGFDAFNKGAATIVRALLQENNELRCEIARLRREDMTTEDTQDND